MVSRMFIHVAFLLAWFQQPMVASIVLFFRCEFRLVRLQASSAQYPWRFALAKKMWLPQGICTHFCWCTRLQQGKSLFHRTILLLGAISECSKPLHSYICNTYSTSLPSICNETIYHVISMSSWHPWASRPLRRTRSNPCHLQVQVFLRPLFRTQSRSKNFTTIYE